MGVIFLPVHRFGPHLQGSYRTCVQEDRIHGILMEKGRAYVGA